MANFVITKYCQRHCEYCFTPSDWRALSSPAEGLMTLDEFRQACAFLKPSGRPSLSLLGGEPTTHPHFPLFVAHALDLGFAVRVVTNGEIPDAYLTYLCQFKREQVTLLVNLCTKLSGSVTLTPRQEAALQQAGPLATLSFTIGEVRPDVASWIQLIKVYRLYPHVRLGIAHPAPGLDNQSLHPDDRIQVGHHLVDITRTLHAAGIGLDLDCGLTPCMFSQPACQELAGLGIHLPFVCGPIPDIGPGLEVWHCFPCYNLGRCRLTDLANLDEIKSWLAKLTSPYRIVGLYQQCLTCPHNLRGECSGGCLGHILSSFSNGLTR